jgi:hypothetical protein
VQRVFGSIAVFAGWLSIGIGAIAGIAASQFFGLNHVEGDLPPADVYGIAGAVVLWVFVAAAILAIVPLAMALIAVDPQRPLRLWAVAMAVAGLALLPDDLGRAFGLPLLAGAACLEVGGQLIHRGAIATGPSDAGAGARTWSFEFDRAPVKKTSASDPAPPESANVGPAVPPWTANETVSAASPEAGVLVSAETAAATGPAASDAAMPAGTVAAPPPQSGPRPAGASRRRSSGGRPKIPERVCSWCSTAVPANAETCPNCHATQDTPAVEELPIPGLTEVPPQLRRYAEEARARKRQKNVLGLIFGSSSIPMATGAPPPSDAAALRPPSAALKAEMARLDEEISAGRVPPGAESADGGDSARNPESAGEVGPDGPQDGGAQRN